MVASCQENKATNNAQQPGARSSYKNSRKKFVYKAHYLDAVFADFLKLVFDRLSNDVLLERCLPGHTQNQNECINSSIWLKCFYDEILMSCLSQKFIYTSSLRITLTFKY